MASIQNVAVVGATGLVGLEIRKIMDSDPELRGLKAKLFASTPRAEMGVMGLEESFKELQDCKYILNAASSEAAQHVRDRLSPGQMLIDNSSAFRLDPDVPLVVPEVNGAQLEADHAVVANPNCTAIILCMGLNALKVAGATLTRVVVATYQAASGAGVKGLDELDQQIKALGKGDALPAPEVFPFHLAGNVLSHNTAIRSEDRMGAGYNEEEWKVIEESRKILDIRHLALSATCMRVPVRRAHTEAVSVDIKEEWDLAKLRAAFAEHPGIKVVDDWEKNHFPMPLEAEDKDLVLVGRIRRDPSLAKTVHFILAGDQIRKGAALNALQIMKAHIKLHNPSLIGGHA